MRQFYAPSSPGMIPISNSDTVTSYVGLYANAADYAEMEASLSQGFVVMAGSDGYTAKVVPDVAAMEQAVHDLLCCCGGQAETCDMFKSDYLADLRDDDHWTHNYPDYKRDQFHIDLEDGWLTVARLTAKK